MARRATKKQAATAAGEWRKMNRLQIAALLGVHADTVTDYARQGMPVLAAGGAGREGVYDAVDCLEWWRDRQGKNAKELAQTRALQASAELNELKLAREKGELLSRDVVLLEGQAYAKGWSAWLRAFPRRLVQAGFITSEAEAPVAAMIRQLLEEIASWRSVPDVERSKRKADAA